MSRLDEIKDLLRVVREGYWPEMAHEETAARREFAENAEENVAWLVAELERAQRCIERASQCGYPLECIEAYERGE